MQTAVSGDRCNAQPVATDLEGETMFGGKAAYKLEAETDERGHRSYTYHPLGLGLWGIFVGLTMIAMAAKRLSTLGFGIGDDERILVWLFGLAGLWLAAVGLRLALRREMIKFYPKAKTIVWDVTGILGKRHERVPYHKALLRVHRCSVYTRRPFSAGWALALDVPRSQIILAWSDGYNDIQDSAKLLSEATEMEWGRAATPTARWLL